MGCELIKTGDATVIICGRTGRGRCKWCGRPSAKLCDYPVMRDGKKGTCDARMCARCSTEIEKGQLRFGEAPPETVDYCPPHFRHYSKQVVEAAERITEECRWTR